MCRDVVGMMALFSLMLGHIYSGPRMLDLYQVETPFKSMLERR